MSEFLLTLPVYNEIDNFERLVREILPLAPQIDILVVEDSSPDGTGKVADELSRQFQNIKVIHRPRKSGRGSASLVGYRYAIENGYKYYAEMDCDLSHRPEELPALIDASKSADIVIGSRFINGGGVDGWNWKRNTLHSTADLAIRIILGLKATDPTNGYHCYSVDMLKKINFDRLNTNGYVAHTIMKALCFKTGHTIKEIPSFFINRRSGKSKMSFREAPQGIIDMLKFRWMCIRHGYRYFLK